MADAADIDQGTTDKLDIVVFGATGFVGTLVAKHLAEHAPAVLRIGLAGRSTQKLEATRAELGTAASRWPLIVADAADEDALARLAAASKVIASTVGPYAKYGLPWTVVPASCTPVASTPSPPTWEC